MENVPLAAPERARGPRRRVKRVQGSAPATETSPAAIESADGKADYHCNALAVVEPPQEAKMEHQIGTKDGMEEENSGAQNEAPNEFEAQELIEGDLFVLGAGDMGQLGLGDGIDEVARPRILCLPLQ
ncbi:unnamed protein product, partial [Ostreobium quekettii]